MKKLLAGILVLSLALGAVASFSLAEQTPAGVAITPEPLIDVETADASAPMADAPSDDASTQIVQLTVDTVSTASGDEAKVALSIANGNGVDSLECNLNYNAAAIQVTHVEAGVTFPAEYCITNTNEPGRVRLATACAFGLDNEQGTVIILHVKLIGEAGSAITISDARVTTVGAEYLQSKAYVGIKDGGVTVGGAALPQGVATPWIPETPIPTATPTPEPTEVPAPEIMDTPVPSETPEPLSEEPAKPAMLPYVIAGVIAVLLAAGIVILLVSSSSKKKKRKKKRKAVGKSR